MNEKEMENVDGVFSGQWPFPEIYMLFLGFLFISYVNRYYVRVCLYHNTEMI